MIVKVPNWMYRKWRIKGFTLGTFQMFHNYDDKINVNHENIHLAQFKEVGFWKTLRLYWTEFFQWKKIYDVETAFHLISFEREAYANAENLKYLETREKNAWKKYLT